jgi:pimeloyl-ACP methyl ester carboxylesterase
MSVVPLSALLAALFGWSDITVEPNRASRSQGYYAPSVASLDRPSERTEDTLVRYDLKSMFRSDPEAALLRLEKIARQQPDADLVYALAELSWVEGRRLDRWRRAAAIDRFIDTVAYAYDFLFDPELADPQRAADPRYRQACNLYNGGLERLLRVAQSNGQIMPDGTIRLKSHGKEQVLPVLLTESPWTAADVDQLIIASDFEVSGLPTRNYQYGLGVPLIGVHNAEHPGKEGPERFYPPEMAFPLTAFLVPNSRLHDPVADIAPPRECRLQLVDPVRHPIVGPQTASISVEADLSTPLAYMWSRTDLDRYRWTGLFRPGEALGRANLMLLRPYEPGKIPVVMVHGLISSPLAWIPMLNELLRDPTIQQRYQFLLFMYPTGVPLPIAAALLRDSLQELERTYNPSARDPEAARTVLLGHSMGGLLSHMMAVNSGDRLWQINTFRRFEDMMGPPGILEELRHYLFFDEQPYVRRVVFLATPHRGSDLSRKFVGRVGASLISEPDQIGNLLTQLIKDNPNTFERRFRRLPSSIETLEPDSKILEALLHMPANPSLVTFHSIIGSNRPSGIRESTDGVVPYHSAHFDGVASELVVPSDHSVQKSQDAIREVRRILLEHLGLSQVSTRPPVAQTPDLLPTLSR